MRAVIAALSLFVFETGTADADSLSGGSTARITGSVAGNSAAPAVVPSADNRVIDGFDNMTGISVVQQNTGDNNILSATVGVIDSLGSITGLGAAASTASLNTVVSGNLAPFSSVDGLPTRTNVVSGAFNGASGVALIQQNTGNNNAISAAISVASSGTPFSFGLVQQISAAAAMSGAEMKMENGGAAGVLPPGGSLSLGPGR